MAERDEIEVRRGGPRDTPRLLALFDDAIAWLVARGQTGQWGREAVLLTAAAFRGRGVGRALIDQARRVAREQGAEQLRVDCWDGTPGLPAAYVRLGFERVGSFDVKGWPGAILAMPV